METSRRRTFGLPLCSGLGSATSAPCVNANGTMTQTSAEAFISAMNTTIIGGVKGYLGRTDWTLPPSMGGNCHYAECAADPSNAPLASLYYNLLGLSSGDSVANYYTSGVGPFSNVQPYLYWSCEAENPEGSALGSACSLIPQCTTASHPPCATDMEWSFNFGDGFQGTDEELNDLFVTAFSPNAVPEPATWALVLFGLGMMAMVRLRSNEVICLCSWYCRQRQEGTVTLMTATGLLFAFLIIAVVAIAVTGSTWVGIIIAALELGFWALTRYVWPARRLGH